MRLNRLLLCVGLVLFCYGGMRGTPTHREFIIAPFVPWSFFLGLLLLCVSGVRYWVQAQIEAVLAYNRERTWKMWLSTFPEGGG